MQLSQRSRCRRGALGHRAVEAVRVAAGARDAAGVIERGGPDRVVRRRDLRDAVFGWRHALDRIDRGEQHRVDHEPRGLGAVRGDVARDRREPRRRTTTSLPLVWPTSSASAANRPVSRETSSASAPFVHRSSSWIRPRRSSDRGPRARSRARAGRTRGEDRHRRVDRADRHDPGGIGAGREPRPIEEAERAGDPIVDRAERRIRRAGPRPCRSRPRARRRGPGAPRHVAPRPSDRRLRVRFRADCATRDHRGRPGCPRSHS